MAGRGCNITVQVLRDDGQVEDISLPVALHTPLFVLKGQLGDMVGMPVETQVLILCDMSDPDRNSDQLLENDDLVLRECGVRDGSILSLHRIGANIPPPPAAAQGDEDEDDGNNVYHDEEGVKAAEAMGGDSYSLPTRTTADKADHSYNGVVFDVKVLSAYEVQLNSISLAGMLGRIVSRCRQAYTWYCFILNKFLYVFFASSLFPYMIGCLFTIIAIYRKYL